MNKLLKHFLLLLFISKTAFAEGLPLNRADFCARFQSELNKEMVLILALDSVNLMSFKNNGGLFNQGVCWWHSRFQRNVLYLGIFKPELPRPNVIQTQKIIRSIRAGMNVVTIPGYSNFSEFTTVNQKLIQAELNDWQLFDGIFQGAWIGGLQGDTVVPASTLFKMMSNLFDYVTVKKKIAYQKLQIKGIVAHAWLIVGAKQLQEGIDFGYIDSNSPRMSRVYTYKFGDTSFFIKGYGNFVPYLEFTREEQRITDAGKTFCGIKNFIRKTPEQHIQDYQLDLASAKEIH